MNRCNASIAYDLGTCFPVCDACADRDLIHLCVVKRASSLTKSHVFHITYMICCKVIIMSTVLNIIHVSAARPRTEDRHLFTGKKTRRITLESLRD